MNLEEMKRQLAQDLTKARLERGLTQKELEQLSGVRQPVIARTETCVTTPNMETIMKMLSPLG